MAAEPAVTVICFSKDRSFQLRECLRTIQQFVRGELSIHVLYTVRPEFEKSYDQIKSEYPEVEFVREEDFGEQLRHLVAEGADHVLLCCDDSLYFREVDMRNVVGVLADKQVVSYHLMLHPGLSFCHPQGKPSSPPAAMMPAGTHSNKWIRLMGSLEWNYPWDLSSTVYRREDVVSMLECIVAQSGVQGISHPNRLELSGMKAVLSGSAPEGFTGALAACPVAPTAAAVVLNRVQEIFENPIYEETNQSVEDLEALFWEGRRFDTAFYGAKEHNAMHIGDFVLEELSSQAP
eukprot:TRINITY_DN9230_c0_g1_i1.p1 TRINITY_DN9230_c0_g1~~TRINITY_DN9230_c0_g1_i1.p1  ORF type:complete len:291 (+),score=59.95 TRINITY_DN9230_c0_g1_i1:200-1072(+)